MSSCLLIGGAVGIVILGKLLCDRVGGERNVGFVLSLEFLQLMIHAFSFITLFGAAKE
jgi:hypothetical protein